MLSERPLMVLCDIEGVLLDVPGESARHRQALESAVQQVTGLSVALSESRDGHTDYTFICAAFDRAGLSGMVGEREFGAIAEHATALYLQSCPQDLGDAVRPGVAATLAELAADPGVRVVPCSGAMPGIALALIERAELGPPLWVGYGKFAAFGRTRPDLVRLAREHVAGSAALPWPAEKTVVVSRSGPDIAAAASDGVHTVAIAVHSSVAEARIVSFECIVSALARWRS